MTNRTTFSLVGLISTSLLAMATAGILPAAPTTAPSGLNPGDQYRLVFVTQGTTDATSTNITDYDNFVTAQANSNGLLVALNTNWRVIGTTSSESAYTHIGGAFATPIYNLAGQLVANGSADLWDGSITSPIRYDQNGNDKGNSSVATGTATTGFSLGVFYLGDTYVEIGTSHRTDPGWVNDGSYENWRLAPFFGISDVLTVPGDPVPEPGTMGLLAAALVGFWLRRRRQWYR